MRIGGARARCRGSFGGSPGVVAGRMTMWHLLMPRRWRKPVLMSVFLEPSGARLLGIRGFFLSQVGEVEWIDRQRRVGSRTVGCARKRKRREI